MGEDSITVRQKKNPDISYAKINEIVRNDLLQGKEGTSWYISGWHRGTISTMKKLFAYSPVVLPGTEDEENPCPWVLPLLQQRFTGLCSPLS